MQDFEDYLNSSNFALNTRKSYMSDISAYCKECKIVSVGDINATSTADYIKRLSAQGVSPSKINRTVSSIRMFFKSSGIDIPVNNPILHQKAEKKMPVILDKNEIVNFLSIPKGNSYKSVRDKLILKVMYYTGIKVSELTELTVKDINFEIGTVIIRENSGRSIPINADLINELNYYIHSVRHTLSADTEFLFINTKGEKLTRQGVWKIISYYSDKSSISKVITPNTLRHSFATHLIDSGVDAKNVKYLLGLNNTTSVSAYIEYLKEQYSNRYLK